MSAASKMAQSRPSNSSNTQPSRNPSDIWIEALTIPNLANNRIETRYCNMSEILQQPGMRVLTHPVQLQPIFVSNISPAIPTLMLSEVVFNGYNENANTQNLLMPTSLNQLPDVQLIDIADSSESTNKITVDQETYNKPIQTFKPIPDTKAPPRAQAVLPQCLQYRNGIVTPKTNLPEFVLFGPVEGILEKLSLADAQYLVSECVEKERAVFLIPDADDNFFHVDLSDLDKSNWIALLALGNQNTANVWLHLIENKIYVLTTKSISAKEALAIGYTRDYVEQTGIPVSAPILDLSEELQRNRREWRCKLCDISMCSSTDLECHNNKNHKKKSEKHVRSQKYRCQHCLRRFSRLFCLKRHLLLCSKKQSSEEKQRLQASSADLNNFQAQVASQNTQKNSLENDEEPRLPSDESMQNFTNILDFSTNLFDADRMLDTSLKSDLEFNPLGLKDDPLANDFEFSAGLFSSSPKKQVKKAIPIPREKTPSPFTCPYCKVALVRSKYRQHSRVCSARTCACFCGKKFRHKNALAVHIFKFHRTHSPNKMIMKGSSLHQIKKKGSTRKRDIMTETNYELPSFNSSSEKDNALSKAENVQQSTDDIPPELETDSAENKEQETNESCITNNKYQCPQCSFVFKRRGMLVNHLWRAHEASPAAAGAVPLEVAERRYPCPGCPKLYRAAAKRKTHMAVRHPGLALPAGSLHYIELGRRRRAPARCWACPRQYATRAKLLQHARQTHPGHVPPPHTGKVVERRST